jgi:hypothetical protein
MAVRGGPGGRGPEGPATTPATSAAAAPVPASVPSTGIDRLKLIGGLVALSAGLAALIIVVIVALALKPTTSGGSIATAAIGVIGSIVGAYFGVKIGSDGTQQAVDGQRQEAAKAQAFALHVHPQEAEPALAEAQRLLGELRGPHR